MQQTTESPIGKIDDAHWWAVERRAASGSFILGLKTAGVCGCQTRTAKRGNVAAFHVAEAL